MSARKSWMSSRHTWRRSLGAGLVYGAAYFLTELTGTAAVLAWLGTGVGILWVLCGELLWLAAQYALFGALMGLLVAAPVGWLERGPLRRFAGPGLELMALALAFIAVALLWNPESILPRRSYVLVAFGAQLTILAVAGLGLGLLRLLRPLGRRVTAAAAGLAAAGLVAAAAWSLLGGSTGQAGRRASVRPGADRPPNVVLVVIDTLRRDRVSAYGYHRKTSPNLDRLAAEGALFERAYTTASWTLPAHASLFTGLYTASHGTDNGRIRLPSAHRTLAEILAEAGYRTAGFSANPWLSTMSGLDQGFETFEYLGIQTTTSGFFLNLFKGRLRLLLHGTDRLDLGAADITDRLLRWISDVRRGGEPFFVFLNYMEVHEPYGTVPEPFFSAFLSEQLPRDIGRGWVRETPLFLCASCDPSFDSLLECRADRWHVPEEQLRHAVDLYDAGLLYVDHHIGRILDSLERDGMLEHTVVLVTSDHGESLGERGQMGHGGLLYNSVLDIPLLVRYPPAFAPGTRISEAVSLVDVLPTVEELAGLARSDLPDTVSLLPGSGLAGRPERVLTEYVPIAENVWKAVGRRLRCDYHIAGRSSASLQKGHEKLIWSSTGELELFDLAADPREERNLVSARPEAARNLEAELRAWRLALLSRSEDGETFELDPATKQTLESLGYIGH
jgi:arylsulfatase A-like enzyme